MNVLLIQNSPFLEDRSWSYIEHLGMGYLEKALKLHEVNVEVYDATLNWDDVNSALGKIINSSRPYNLLGFSVNRSNFANTIETILLARKNGFSGHICLGGYFPTFHFEKILANFPEIDSIVLGNGEYTLVDLCMHLREGKSSERVKGLAYRYGEGLIGSSLCYENESFLNYIGIPVHRPKYGVARIITSRGCSFQCAFCCVRIFNKFNFRIRYFRRKLDEVIEEIDRLVLDHKVRHIWLSDMDFIGRDHEYIECLCDALIKRNYNLTLEGDCRLDSLTEPLIKKLAQAGFRCIFVGVETFIERQLNDYKKSLKNFKKDGVMDTISVLLKYNIIPRLGFIMFDKDTTLEELMQNHEIIKTKVGYGSLDGLANKLLLLPGSKIEQEYLKDRMHCYKVDINMQNRSNAKLYYTQYDMVDKRVQFAYNLALIYREKISRLQALFEEQLDRGLTSYEKHCNLLWRLRDQFSPILEEILKLCQSNIFEVPFDFFEKQDCILINFCANFGLSKKRVIDVLNGN